MSQARKTFNLTVEECAADLREAFPPGSTAYTVLRHVSGSGMSRGIDVYALGGKGADPRWMSPRVGVLLGELWDDRRECLKVGGCGMDMGFSVVYNMAGALYGHGRDLRSMVSAIPLSSRDKRRLSTWRRRELERYSGANVSGAYSVSQRWM